MQELIDALMTARDGLNDLIDHKTPGQDGVTKAQYDDLVDRRDKLTQAINKALVQGFKASTQALEQACQQLEAENQKLGAAKSTSDAVKRGFDIAGNVLGIISKVVAFVV